MRLEEANCRSTPAKPPALLQELRLIDDQYAIVSAEVFEDVGANDGANFIGMPAGASQQLLRQASPLRTLVRSFVPPRIHNSPGHRPCMDIKSDR